MQTLLVILSSAELEKEHFITSTEDLEEALAAVDEGAVAVYKNTYPNEPFYHVLRTKEALTEFEHLITNVRDAKPGEVPYALGRLQEFVGTSWITTEHLVPLFKEGKWEMDRETLLQDESGTRLQEEDNDFYDAQREHFSPEAEEKRRLAWEEEIEKRKQIRLEQSDDNEDS